MKQFLSVTSFTIAGATALSINGMMKDPHTLTKTESPSTKQPIQFKQENLSLQIALQQDEIQALKKQIELLQKNMLYISPHQATPPIFIQNYTQGGSATVESSPTVNSVITAHQKNCPTYQQNNDHEINNSFGSTLLYSLITHWKITTAIIAASLYGYLYWFIKKSERIMKSQTSWCNWRSDKEITQ